MPRRKYREIYYFFVPIKKELDNGKTVTYKLKFIDRFRFTSTSLPKLVKYLSERLHSNINIKDITDVYYTHANRVFKNFINKNLGEYHDCMFRVIHYCLQMYLEILEKNALKYMNLILLIIYLRLD